MTTPRTRWCISVRRRSRAGWINSDKWWCPSIMLSRDTTSERGCSGMVPLRLYLPLQVGGTEGAPTFALGSIQKPDSHGAGGAVAPDQVGVTIAVDIAHPRNLPLQVGGAEGATTFELDSIQEPDIHRAGGAVAPDQVGVTVAVDIAHPCNLPLQVGGAEGATTFELG